MGVRNRELFMRYQDPYNGDWLIIHILEKDIDLWLEEICEQARQDSYNERMWRKEDIAYEIYEKLPADLMSREVKRTQIKIQYYLDYLDLLTECL